MKKILFCSCLFFNLAFAQEIHPDIISKAWKAYWITVPDQPAKDYGVYQFRKEIDIESKPPSFIVHVSADNRYKLFVNGHLVSLGPARGDLFHWNFESVDISPFLKEGRNVITAVVWNFGDQKPEAQISFRTAFILQGNTEKEKIINTDKSWQCRRDSSYKPFPVQIIYSYYVAGPGEDVNMNLSNEGKWLQAQQIFAGVPKGVFAWSDGWMLVPRTIPQMEMTLQRFPSQQKSVTVRPNTKTTMLLDQGYLTNAYPVLKFSGGKNAEIILGYAEALYINENSNDWRRENKKGNRNETEGKRFVGVKDRIISNGRSLQEFSSLSYRTYRYLQVEIATRDEALVIDDIYGMFTGYPFVMNASFNGGDEVLSKILEVGWRTARLDAMETYMDCPYYEQLQYVGDTRIQCLVSLYNSGDDRLMRNAISQIDQSRMAEGITMSRYPTANAQQIPPFSLWYIGMLHDYWMYRPDSNFVRSKLHGVRQVLDFFKRYQQADGSLKNLPYWNFTDWCESKGWNAGVAPVGANGNSAVLDLQLLWAYQLAAELEGKLGMKEYSSIYAKEVSKLRNTIRNKYLTAENAVYSDVPEKTLFSQHANSLAILTGVATPEESKKLAQKILHDTSMTEATIYFKYYVHLALTKAGLGDQYLDWLNIWKENLKYGLTTWAEISDINRARSDCHAWGSSPNIEFFRIVLGIDTDAPGFKKVKIEPHLGSLTKVSGTMPHPNGEIKVTYELKNNHWEMNIELPKDISGSFTWKKKIYKLVEGGKTKIKI